MSCLRSRKIKNPIDPKKKGFYDKSSISISDCRCSKCRKSKQNDWLVRSYFEYTSKKTSAFFVTLDFDDEHLPRYDGIPCFDSKLMSNFFETLRQVHGIPKFRYLYSSDYGGFLERPHYHVAFLFDKDAISLDDFTAYITFYWKFGSYENIQEVNLRYKGNPFKCFEYICKYTTKDLKFHLRKQELSFPHRYRSLTQASVGYGSQALDPSEFNSARFIKEGIQFLDHPVITRDYLFNHDVVFLNINNNGKEVPFKIPRFYEMKLMYDYHYDSFTKKSEQIRNSDGHKLQDLRYNRQYVYLFNSFRDSYLSFDFVKSPVLLDIFASVFPDSPYLGMQWKDIVEDVLLREDDFLSVCKVFEFMDFVPVAPGSSFSVPKVYEFNSGIKKYSHVLGCYGHYRKFFSYNSNYLFVQALSLFKIFKSYEDSKLAVYDDWKQLENEKCRLLEVLKRFPAKRRYLRRKNFDFNKLKPLKFSDYAKF